MWIASKFMIALLPGVFAFFWTHTALWFYREYQDRQERKSAPARRDRRAAAAAGQALPALRRRLAPRPPRFRAERDDAGADRHGGVLRRNRAGRRSSSTRSAARRSAAFIHRVARDDHARHLLHPPGATWRSASARTAQPSNWFGPTSLMPNWQDLKDAVAHVQVVLRQGAAAGVRPLDLLGEVRLLGGVLGRDDHRRQRPDAGVPARRPRRSCRAGCSTSATIVHGEEAFLAAVFLFTVHFFNNHFRPDKLPPLDIVMFTGAVPLEEFRREHALEYQRLVRNRRACEAPGRRAVASR